MTPDPSLPARGSQTSSCPQPDGDGGAAGDGEPSKLMEGKGGTLSYSQFFCTLCVPHLGECQEGSLQNLAAWSTHGLGMPQLCAPHQEASVGAGCPCHALCKESQAPYPAPAWLSASLHPTEGSR